MRKFCSWGAACLVASITGIDLVMYYNSKRMPLIEVR